jgi:sulfoxide reductase heme-binding subunit YedZ
VVSAVTGASAVEWYAVRAGGIVAYLLLTLSVLVGVALAGRVRTPGWPRFAVEDVHRFAGILAGVFVGVHVGLLLLDDYVPMSLADVTIPGVSGYHPRTTALGIVAAELLLALAITNRYRRRLGQRTWRRLHYANFAVWALALLHGALLGTDRGSAWGTLLFAITAAAVTAATSWRVLTSLETRGRRPPVRSQPAAAPRAEGPPPVTANGAYQPWPGLFDDEPRRPGRAG